MKCDAFVEEWKKKYARKELGPKTYDIYVRFLNNRILPVFGHMRLDQVKPYHVVKFISELGEEARKYKEVTPYNDEELAALFTILENQPIHWRVMILLALTTGLRRGELVGLGWKHINLDKGILSVEQTISMFENGQPVIAEPKTEKSKNSMN